MQHLIKILALILGFTCTFTGFASSATEMPILGKTITQEKQQKMTPKEALHRLKEGNQRFLSHTQISRDYLKQAYQSSYGQYPFAVILNCMDSRSVPEFFLIKV